MTRRARLLVVGLLAQAVVLLALQALFLHIILEPTLWWSEAWELLSDPRRFMREIFATGIGRTYVVYPVVILVLTQAVFLLPQLHFASQRTASARSLAWSLGAAGLVAAAVFTAIFLAAASVLSMLDGRDGEVPGDPIGDGLAISAHWLLPPLVLSWVMWTLVIRRFAQRRPGHTLPDRLIGLLLAGTILETLIVIPIDIMVRRKTDCYCSTGTFHSLWLSGLALLWLSGPGALLALTSRRRRRWAETHCLACSYEKGPTPGRVCPECGQRWDEEPVSPAPERAAPPARSTNDPA